MSDWIGFGFLILIVLVAIVALSILGKPYDVSQEEFDKRAHEAPGIMSAGLVGIQKLLDPGAQKAAVVQEDQKQGFLDGEQESGDGNDTDNSEMKNSKK